MTRDRLAAEIEVKEGRCRGALTSLAKGRGTYQSLTRAAYYYYLAGENGVDGAYYRADHCYKNLGGKENLSKAEACSKLGDKLA